MEIEEPLEVKYVKWGLANNFGTHIELNEGLKSADYRLREYIIEHERGHHHLL